MTKITVAKGDGIGPEIMDATLEIILAAGAKIEIETIDIGEKVYLSGNTSGIARESWDIIRRNKVFLKAPITTPQGGGYKSLNVTTRKFLGLYANVRPCLSLHPFVDTKHPKMDIVIIRENEEDLYAGIEHQQTDEVVQCLKLISRPGCEKIVRYAFEYAKHNGRKKVTCFTKDNIMKQTDGLFHKVFDEIALEYPEIENEHWIIDIGAAKMADTPEAFDVIVVPNLYGDVLSDIAAQIAGSVGLAGSSNIGEECAMFEAIHGSAPRRAGQNVANPSGLLQGAILMLQHIGQMEVAEKVQNAWLKTIEDGIHTYDIYQEGTSTQKVGTKEFAQAVIANLGQKPKQLQAVEYAEGAQMYLPKYVRKAPAKKEIVGVDLFVHWSGNQADDLAAQVSQLNHAGLELSMITNRGIKVWPEGFPETFCTDHWRCRFKGLGSSAQIPALLEKAISQGIDVIKTENLYEFDGKAAYSLGQGQ
ncbi:NADP-dependent isocitrate dehydrogenase [Flectobacillus roseus]|uniref:Isocitrate dehydrogenase [NADP] n=1 Tax=Flectobacillus roseus TaxID=502259 RepID=A0ABT6YDG0_9BACT|nr:NADP-dependent isocitrate dehydrogenase [Flectobacillus roseus]MDI9861619.1 NADP-dependent isocitrate dehydrogenase [Flectobacillus roseus]MDI9869638.1 NADP-dependent isocitrate dehydrogenase [Flectobacillus roseus]NBA77846.1 NADP-dependent isocitrate dehydrogenase [Emticicia sp. ODNR4P]